MTYADLETVRAYLAESGLAIPPTDDEVLTSLIERAERDVDRFVGGPVPDGATLRLDPEALTDQQQPALARAVAAQVEYRLLSGERSWSESEDLTGPDVTVLAPWTRIGPKVGEELAGFGLIRRTLTAAPTPAPTPSE